MRTAAASCFTKSQNEAQLPTSLNCLGQCYLLLRDVVLAHSFNHLGIGRFGKCGAVRVGAGGRAKVLFSLEQQLVWTWCVGCFVASAPRSSEAARCFWFCRVLIVCFGLFFLCFLLLFHRLAVVGAVTERFSLSLLTDGISVLVFATPSLEAQSKTARFSACFVTTWLPASLCRSIYRTRRRCWSCLPCYTTLPTPPHVPGMPWKSGGRRHSVVVLYGLLYSAFELPSTLSICRSGKSHFSSFCCFSWPTPCANCIACK